MKTIKYLMAWYAEHKEAVALAAFVIIFGYVVYIVSKYEEEGRYYSQCLAGDRSVSKHEFCTGVARKMMEK
jgi:hypothetical protein